MGAGEAAGMFPIDSATLDFEAGMVEKFDALIAGKGPLSRSISRNIPEPLWGMG